MSKKVREKITIEKNILRSIIYGANKDSDFICVKDEITSSDIEDGGGDHDCVIKRKSDNMFFAFSYTD